jgi:hypothetical protein
MIQAIPPGTSAEIVFHFSLPIAPGAEYPVGVNAAYYPLRYQENELITNHWDDLVSLIDESAVQIIGYQDLVSPTEP